VYTSAETLKKTASWVGVGIVGRPRLSAEILTARGSRLARSRASEEQHGPAVAPVVAGPISGPLRDVCLNAIADGHVESQRALAYLAHIELGRLYCFLGGAVSLSLADADALAEGFGLSLGWPSESKPHPRCKRPPATGPSDPASPMNPPIAGGPPNGDT
jgi:hypothetical protein